MVHVSKIPGALVPKTRRGRERRAQLLQAAEAVFGENGFGETSISEITRRAGTSQGTFYIYFSGKDAIFRELVGEMGRVTRRVIARAVAAAPDRITAEKSGLQAFLEFVHERPALYNIVEEARFVDKPAYDRYFSAFAEAYRLQLAAAAARGEISPGDAEVRAWALMGIAKALGERFGVRRSARSVAAVVEAAFELIDRGLRP